MTNKTLLFISLLILGFGIALFAYSLTLPMYSDAELYREKLFEISGNSEKFYELRKEFLTSKVKLEDYGITLSLVGTAALIVAVVGVERLRTPRRKRYIFFYGFLAAILSFIADVCDLMLFMYRGEQPDWADSPGIPLTGVLVAFVMSLIWVFVNLGGVVGEFYTSVPISSFRFKHLSPFYTVLLIITALFTILMTASGVFWYFIPGVIWCYFYLSFLLGKREAKLRQLQAVS